MLATLEKEVISLVGVCPTLEKVVYEPRGYKEEIIRCRDCKHYQKQDELCSYWGLSGTLLDSQSGEGFCAWAERDE